MQESHTYFGKRAREREREKDYRDIDGPTDIEIENDRETARAASIPNNQRGREREWNITKIPYTIVMYIGSTMETHIAILCIMLKATPNTIYIYTHIPNERAMKTVNIKAMVTAHHIYAI